MNTTNIKEQYTFCNTFFSNNTINIQFDENRFNNVNDYLAILLCVFIVNIYFYETVSTIVRSLLRNIFFVIFYVNF